MLLLFFFFFTEFDTHSLKKKQNNSWQSSSYSTKKPRKLIQKSIKDQISLNHKHQSTISFLFDDIEFLESDLNQHHTHNSLNILLIKLLLGDLRLIRWCVSLTKVSSFQLCNDSFRSCNDLLRYVKHASYIHLFPQINNLSFRFFLFLPFKHLVLFYLAHFQRI